MNGNEDSLQPVKYLGKVRSLYAHGMGVAIVSVLFFIRINDDLIFKGTSTSCLDSIEKGNTV
jgi:hypothetical protein